MGDLEASLKSGTLKFRLAGEKLKGGWMLARLKRRPGETKDNWLLIKEHDDAADHRHRHPGGAAGERHVRQASRSCGRAPVPSGNRKPAARPRKPRNAEPPRETAKPVALRPGALKGAKAAAPAQLQAAARDAGRRAAARQGLAARDQVRRLPHDRDRRGRQGAAHHPQRPRLDRALRRARRRLRRAALQGSR